MATHSQIYHHGERLIYDTIWSFRRQSAAARTHSFQELLSDAHLGYLGAIRTYDPRFGVKFTSWLRRSIWCHLQSSVVDAARDHSRHQAAPLSGAEPAHRRAFDLDWLLEEISGDAASVVRAALEMPQNTEEVDGQAQRCRLIRLLLGQGWAAERVSRTFQEIGEALNA